MSKKQYFEERTLAEIRKLNSKRVYNGYGLVDKINGLTNDGLEIRVAILPGRFLFEDRKSSKTMKHGDSLKIHVPETIEEAVERKEKPTDLIRREIESMSLEKEEQLRLLGIHWYPPGYNDRRKRFLPFVSILEGEKIFAYSEEFAKMEIEDYASSKRVLREGGQFVVSVPSREEKGDRYKLRIQHVPIERSDETFSSTWNFKSDFIGKVPGFNFYNGLRYTYLDDVESSDRITIYPQEVAGQLAINQHCRLQGNNVPEEMTPILRLDERFSDFYNKLLNNVYIVDTGNKERKLNMAEKSILLGRAIKVFGMK
jgi:hypothetical protein